MLPTQNLRVEQVVRLATPRALKAQLPCTEAVNQTVVSSRRAVERILRREDPRLLVVVGPCSIHDPKGALDYGQRLAALRSELADTMEIVMRVYFEKPRTTIGWKGLINDPDLDGSYNIEKGLRKARKILLDINALGVPAGSELEYVDLGTIAHALVDRR